MFLTLARISSAGFPSTSAVQPVLQGTERQSSRGRSSPIRQEIRSINNRDQNILRIGVYDSLARNWLPQMINRVTDPHSSQLFTAEIEHCHKKEKTNITDRFHLFF